MASKTRSSVKAGTADKIGLHNLVPAPGSHRARRRVGRGPGSGTRQDVRQGSQGFHGAVRPWRSWWRQAALRRWPDAASRVASRSAASPTRSVRKRRSCASTPLRQLEGDEVTTEILLAAGLIRGGQGTGQAARQRRAHHGVHGAWRKGQRVGEGQDRGGRRPRRGLTETLQAWRRTNRGGAGRREHLPDAGTVAEDHLHVPVSGDLPNGRARHGARYRRARR